MAHGSVGRMEGSSDTIFEWRACHDGDFCWPRVLLGFSTRNIHQANKYVPPLPNQAHYTHEQHLLPYICTIKHLTN